MNARLLPAALAAAVVFSAAPAGGATETAADSATVASAARSVLRTHCSRCHSGEGSPGGSFDVLDVASLKKAGHLDADSPADSFVLDAIETNYMPPTNIREQAPVPESDRAALRAWLAAGAPDFPSEADRQHVMLTSVLSAVRDDLRETTREDRPTRRYFSLHTLFNNPNVLASDLPAYRAALSKSVNSMSWEPTITPPREVTGEGLPGGVLYAVDLRDYGWDAADWQTVLKAYPYGLSYGNLGGDEGETLGRLGEDLEDLSGTTLPIVRADWFVAAAARPPLYNVLLDLPETELALEKKLDVDVKRHFADPRPRTIARAGFSRSGVSAQNRLVERHASPYGAYWKSYDFGPDNGRGKLTRFPLGPAGAFTNHERLAFKHDGGEAIFSLPNGLHGYFLSDGAGAYLHAGPIEVVGDTLKTAGTPSIVNGVSCFACHKTGMIDLTDTMRTGNGVFGEAEDLIRQLHPPKEEMDRLVQSDRAAYLRALRQAVAEFDDSEPTAEGYVDPIGHVARQHRLVFLDGEAVAAELNLASFEELRDRVSHRDLKELGLEPLLEGGAIGRPEWEATYRGVSLMQELARRLRYTPVTPL
ncbi:hypothetical protein [Alienimonas californiensis]|uniref:Planctomycete cytochrome C n=1 Tax=Alienimonas californiensis TaxID=2527989 RepID=A0A517P6J0_9PLAN|nr:hypothetical protein [Alienimonas californiensis]QDT14995.1 hypothetical protein CA12_10750 [Alienimonas californiensis]